MALILVGINYKTAPVEIREKLAVGECDLPELLMRLREVPGVRGATVISTCNRVETVISADSEDVTDSIVGVFTSRANASRSQLEKHLYILRHRDVVRHLFRVASGLDSMILGEPQIHGQVRSAFQKAQSCNALDTLLVKLFEQTMRVAKRIRTETGIGEHAVSVPFAAVELAKKIFGELDGLQILLVGAGKISELTAKHLSGFGLKKILVANRSFEKGRELAQRFDGEAIEFAQLAEKIRDCDIVIASTSSPTFVIGPDEVEDALGMRKRRNIFLIDLSVPRNIDPQVAELDGAFLYNVDDLREVADSNKEKRQQRAEAAEIIVDREVDGFLKRLATGDAVPTILELQGHLDEMRKAELEKCLRRLGPIPAEQREAIEQLSSAIINKVLHYPIVRLKESAAEEPAAGRESTRETIRRIFGLR